MDICFCWCCPCNKLRCAPTVFGRIVHRFTWHEMSSAHHIQSPFNHGIHWQWVRAWIRKGREILKNGLQQLTLNLTWYPNTHLKYWNMNQALIWSTDWGGAPWIPGTPGRQTRGPYGELSLEHCWRYKKKKRCSTLSTLWAGQVLWKRQRCWEKQKTWKRGGQTWDRRTPEKTPWVYRSQAGLLRTGPWTPLTRGVTRRWATQQRVPHTPDYSQQFIPVLRSLCSFQMLPAPQNIYPLFSVCSLILQRDSTFPFPPPAHVRATCVGQSSLSQRQTNIFLLGAL